MTPYESYRHFARTVAGIEPKSEEDWERDSNREIHRLPMGATSGQIFGSNMQARSARARESRQRRTAQQQPTSEIP
jgi:hypothetical protein